MSRSMPAHLGAIEDARLEQAAVAARTARRNQPKGLLAIAGLLLVVAIIYVTMGLFSQRDAAADLADAHDQAQDAVALAGRLNALRAASSSTPAATATVSSLRTRIEQAGLEAGLSRVPLPSERSDTVQTSLGSRKKHFEYNLTDPSLSTLLSWMQRSVAAVPGLEITNVTITPEANNWRVRVVFSRWEKVEGA